MHSATGIIIIYQFCKSGFVQVYLVFVVFFFPRFTDKAYKLWVLPITTPFLFTILTFTLARDLLSSGRPVSLPRYYFFTFFPTGLTLLRFQW